MPIVDFKTSERDQHETPFSKQGRAFSVRGAPLMPGAHGVIFVCPGKKLGCGKSMVCFSNTSLVSKQRSVFSVKGSPPPEP